MTIGKQKRVLIVFFETPPSNGASVQRYLSMYNSFVDAGYLVDVLSVHPSAYPTGNCDGGCAQQILQPGCFYMRPKALDVQRDLAFKGKYIGAMMTPDRWGLTWTFTAIHEANKYLQNGVTPDIVWSSAPIPSVHLVANYIAKKTNAWWVADYRDPMPYLHKSVPWYQRVSQEKIDRLVVKNADQITFATQESLDLYVSKLSSKNSSKDFIIEKCSVVPNGFVSENFHNAEEMVERDHLSPFLKTRFNVYYAGALYPGGRDPAPFLKAVARWNNESSGVKVQVLFQGSSDDCLSHIDLNIDGLLGEVHILPKVSFDLSLVRMLSADALLLIQGSVFNRQIPGKLYEYFYSDTPILLATPKDSATARASIELTEYGVLQGETTEELYECLKTAILTEFPSRRQLVKKYDRKEIGKTAVENISLSRYKP